MIQKSLVIAIQSDIFYFQIFEDHRFPPRVLLSIRFFFSGKIFCVKRPQVSETAKIITIASKS